MSSVFMGGTPHREAEQVGLRKSIQHHLTVFEVVSSEADLVFIEEILNLCQSIPVVFDLFGATPAGVGLSPNCHKAVC
jgi:hypothetical protein